MNRRLGGDASLNSPLRGDGEAEWQDWLVDDSASQETILAEHEESDNRLAALRGGERIVRHGRRCWVLDYTVAVDAIDIVAIEGPLAA